MKTVCSRRVKIMRTSARVPRPSTSTTVQYSSPRYVKVVLGGHDLASLMAHRRRRARRLVCAWT